MSASAFSRWALNALAFVGGGFLATARVAGGMGVLFGRVARGIFPRQSGGLDGRELAKNLYKMAVKSLPIVVVTALFTGAIMVIQAAPIVQRLRRHGRSSAGPRASGRCARSLLCSPR